MGTDTLFKNLSGNEKRWIFGFRTAGLSGYLAKSQLTLL
jgi:hypothetical protein